MFVSKIRTTIALLTATLAVGAAAGPIAPAAHAADNNDSPQISERACDKLWDLFAVYVNQAASADRAKNAPLRDAYLDLARDIKNRARAGGCGWANFRRAKLHRLAQRVTTVGSPTVPPEVSTSTGTTTDSPGPSVDDASAAGTVSPSAAG